MNFDTIKDSYRIMQFRTSEIVVIRITIMQNIWAKA
jgi:hypothetical protein